MSWSLTVSVNLSRCAQVTGVGARLWVSLCGSVIQPPLFTSHPQPVWIIKNLLGRVSLEMWRRGRSRARRELRVGGGASEGQIQISEHDNKTSSSPWMWCFVKNEAKERVMIKNRSERCCFYWKSSPKSGVCSAIVKKVRKSK